MNNSLLELDLTSNSIGDKGAMALAQYLQVRLIFVLLNHFSYCSSRYTNIQTTKTLRSLILTDNGIGDLGAMAIIEVLQTQNTLQRLDFTKNMVSAECDTATAELLKVRLLIISVNLPDFISLFCGILQMNRYLISISLSGNPILCDSAVEMIAGAIKVFQHCPHFLLHLYR
jgi:Ran GTPase-activating protein (RanGAP) involved in mRNA processing and transport